MLELSKQILEKVSFDKKLFKKELKKSLAWVKPQERLHLKAWCLSTFGAMYGDVIVDVFDSQLSTSF